MALTVTLKKTPMKYNALSKNYQPNSLIMKTASTQKTWDDLCLNCTWKPKKLSKPFPKIKQKFLNEELLLIFNRICINRIHKHKNL